MIRRFNPLYALLPMTVFLAACTTEGDESVTPVTDPDGGATGFVATFKPDVALMPFPTDVWRNGSTDGTLNIREFESNPLLTHVEQLNLLDGFGLNSPIWADFSDPLDEDTLVLGQTVFVFRVQFAGEPVTPALVNDKFEISASGFQGGRSVMKLDPIVPLDPLTTYAVLVTAGVQSSDGTSVSADAAFQAMVDAWPGENTGSASTTVEGIYDGMVKSLLDLAEGVAIGADNIVLAWTFTTQSISQPLDAINAMATAQTSAFVPIPKNGVDYTAGIATTSDLNENLTGHADVYIGVIEIPFYLDPENALTSYWQADADHAACQGAIAVEAVAEASASTTVYCPMPEVQATIAVPVLLTVPNGTSAQAGALNGVTVFQHGITQSRTNLLAVADALADAGQVGIAIDLPLHGITDTTSGLYGSTANPLYAALNGIVPDITAALTEQTFNLDLINNETGEDGADEVIDPSGEYFINLESPITARDSIRQGAANLIHLVASLSSMRHNLALSDPTQHFDGKPVSFVGHSLGAITGTIYLGVDDTASAAVLVAPGGDIADLILGSASIYPEVEAGLGEGGLTPGMRFFDEFFRNAQTIVDAGDPINYAVAANAKHNILMMEVVGGAGVDPDQVVPNSATQALADAMGLAAVTTTTIDNAAGVDGLVQFLAGAHGSILSPDPSLQATTEMQTEMAIFIGGHPALGGGILPGGHGIVIVDSSVVAD